jgi:hypothetical protein
MQPPRLRRAPARLARHCADIDQRSFCLLVKDELRSIRHTRGNVAGKLGESFEIPAAQTDMIKPHFIAKPLSRAASSEVGDSSVANRWVETLLEITAFEVDKRGARPTIISRIFFIVTCAMYEAWTAYDKTAIGHVTKGKYRRPAGEHNEANQNVAVSYAALRTIEVMFPFEKADEIAWLRDVLNKRMQALSIDPDDQSTDITAPQGVGNVTAQAIIDDRITNDADKSNQANKYADTTGYKPINPVDKINDPDKWQEIEFTREDGTKFTPRYLTPHWGMVTPFALASGSEFRPGGPPTMKDPVTSPRLMRDVEEIISVNAFMSLETKAIVEIMRDGPGSTSQSGQWFRTANEISTRDNHGLAQDIKMYFALGAIGLDAFIAAWEAKLYYNSSRPWTLVHYLYRGSTIHGWGGPGSGTIKLLGDNWKPFSPVNFITPPFPGYVSGHSTVSGGSARILELITGSDHYGFSTVWEVGSLTEPGLPAHPSYAAYLMQQVEGQPLPDIHMSKYVPLSFPTFTSVAETAGISRVYGGFHIQADNIDGLVLGRKVAAKVWAKVDNLFNGRL